MRSAGSKSASAFACWHGRRAASRRPKRASSFIARLGPALGDVRDALDQVVGLRDEPAGRVRLVTSRMAARMVLAPKLARFARDYPDVVVDLTTTEESRVDLVGWGFDAGSTSANSSNAT